MECISVLFVLFAVVAVLDGLASKGKSDGDAPAQPSAPSAQATLPPPAPQRIASRPTTPVVERAHPVAWSTSAWRSLTADVAGLSFHSTWTFAASVRDTDGWYGESVSIWTLDLHGLDRRLALRAAMLFLDDVRGSANRRCRIISGRGNNSRDGNAVLPRLVENELERRERRGDLSEWVDHDGHFDVLFA